MKVIATPSITSTGSNNIHANQTNICFGYDKFVKISSYTPKYIEQGTLISANFDHLEVPHMESLIPISCSSNIVSTANSSIYSNSNLAYKIKRSFRKAPRIFKLPSDALETFYDFKEKENTEVYQHHLVSTESKLLDGNETLFVVHFFQGPEHVQYWPSQNINPVYKAISLNNVGMKNPFYFLCVAYVMYDNMLWSTDVYPSISDFLYDFKIIIR